MTNRDRILAMLTASAEPLDDDELARRSGIAPRQTVNRICNELANAGLIVRSDGFAGKLVNAIVATRVAGDGETDRDAAPALVPSPGSSREQRAAEAVMLEALGGSLGVELAPRRLRHPSGAQVEVDGADRRLENLVECWAHQGPAKVAQKYKLVNDAVKLNWIARSLPRANRRLIICVSDEAAIRHLRGRSWQGQAISELGVELRVVHLPQAVVASVLDAQKRQYR